MLAVSLYLLALFGSCLRSCAKDRHLEMIDTQDLILSWEDGSHLPLINSQHCVYSGQSTPYRS